MKKRFQHDHINIETVARISGVSPERALEIGASLGLPWTRNARSVWIDADDLGLWLSCIRHGAPCRTPDGDIDVDAA
jgi:hypothetical protein